MENNQTTSSLTADSQNTISIAGLEGLPASIIPIPYVRLVQPTSKNTEVSPGVDAEIGTFLFDDTKTSVAELTFSLLRARHAHVQFERDGEVINTQKILILATVLESEKLFLLSLSPTSFSNFGHLVAQLKEKKAVNVWNYKVIATSEKQENDKGKYYVAKFELKEELTKEEQDKLTLLSQKYSPVLDKKE